MKSEGKIYLICEVLNFYQRKISNLTKEAVRALAHHLFELENLCEAKQLLLTLWKCKKCKPSSDNNYIVKGLESKRKGRGGKTNTAIDIIKFLEVEDANLGIIFLTLKCEVIPSKVLESAAMKDIYVLMHQSDEDPATSNGNPCPPHRDHGRVSQRIDHGQVAIDRQQQEKNS